MNAPKWLKFVKDAWAFDKKVNALKPVEQKAQIAALTTIATADATDPATTMALANECKAKINATITALKATSA